MEVWHDGAKIGTVELNKSAGRWTGEYELPEAGLYGLNGYIETASGVALNKLMALAEFDDSSDFDEVDPYGDTPIGDYADDFEMIGLALIVGGVLVVVIGLRKKG
jgi:hypothetical protein